MKKTVKKVLLACLSLSILTSAIACNKTDDTSKTPTQNNGSGQSNPNGEEKLEHITFEVYSLDDHPDLKSFPLVKEAMEKFNFDFTVQHVPWDSWDAKTRTLAATDSLPEVIAWYNLNYGEYKQWVEQGIFKEFPDLSKYPNLEKIANEYKVFDKVEVDGKLYAFPKVIQSNPWGDFGFSSMIAYRRDWAKQIGEDKGPVAEMTYDELLAYLEKIKQEDPAKLGDKLIPFECWEGGNNWGELIRQWNINYGQYYNKDGKYVFGTMDDRSLEGIKNIKYMYDKGYLYKDSFSDQMEAGKSRFLAGRAAVLFGNINVPRIDTLIKQMQQTNPNFKEDDIGLIMLKQNDGKVHLDNKQEFWASFGFSANARQEVVDRWLMVGNWLLEQEQLEKYAYGVEGTDWQKDASGNVTLNWPKDDQGNYSLTTENGKNYIADQRMFQKMFVLEGFDVWLPGNPAYSSYIVNDLFEAYVKKASPIAEIRPMTYDVDFFSAPLKDEHGIFDPEVGPAMKQAITSNNPDQIWNEAMNEIKPLVDEVLSELNSGITE